MRFAVSCADGCYLNRNTLQAIETAGFDITELEHRRMHGIMISDLIAGHARKTQAVSPCPELSAPPR